MTINNYNCQNYLIRDLKEITALDSKIPDAHIRDTNILAILYQKLIIEQERNDIDILCLSNKNEVKGEIPRDCDDQPILKNFLVMDIGVGFLGGKGDLHHAAVIIDREKNTYTVLNSYFNRCPGEFIEYCKEQGFLREGCKRDDSVQPTLQLDTWSCGYQVIENVLRFFEAQNDKNLHRSRTFVSGSSLREKYAGVFKNFVSQYGRDFAKDEANKQRKRVLRDALVQIQASDPCHPFYPVYESLRKELHMEEVGCSPYRSIEEWAASFGDRASRTVKEFLSFVKGMDASQINDDQILNKIKESFSHSEEEENSRRAVVEKENRELRELFFKALAHLGAEGSGSPLHSLWSKLGKELELKDGSCELSQTFSNLKESAFLIKFVEKLLQRGGTKLEEVEGAIRSAWLEDRTIAHEKVACIILGELVTYFIRENQDPGATVSELFANVSEEIVAKMAQFGLNRTRFTHFRQKAVYKKDIEEVLGELDRLKSHLGGGNRERPALLEQEKYFFGIPLSTCMEYFRDSVRKKRFPARFWKFLCFCFSVSLEESQYEYASKSIQCFSCLLQNKEKVLETLENFNQEGIVKSRRQFGELTGGLTYHPELNDTVMIKTGIESVEQFLREGFKKAQRQGDGELIKYFQSFGGVCFEDRFSKIQNFCLESNGIDRIIDYNPQDTFEVYMGKMLAAISDAKTELEPAAVWQKVKEEGVLEKTFAKKAVKSAEIHAFIVNQQRFYTIKNYRIEEFLEKEFCVFCESGARGKEGFIRHLEGFDNSDEDFFVVAGEEDVLFSTEVKGVKEFVSKKFPEEDSL